MAGNLDVGKAFSEFMNGVMSEAKPSTLSQVTALRNHLFIEMEAAFAQLFEGFSPQAGPCRIVADSVVIEMLDMETGQLYRRPVELRYEENENGIVLTGEDMSGRPSSIVYLSDTYLKKLVDISGGGEDNHKCD